MRTQFIILTLLVTFIGVISQDHRWDSRTMVRADPSTCTNPLPEIKDVEGCPKIIPITIKDNAKEKILAGRIWSPTSTGNDAQIPELSCKGDCNDWYAESKYTMEIDDLTLPPIDVAVVVINPGCTLYVFRSNNYAGTFKEYKGPDTFFPVGEKKDKTSPFYECAWDKNKLCANSLLWTCEQTVLEACSFSEAWRTVANIDNSLSQETTTFTYEKTVGVQYSTEMTKSRKVSNRVALAITAKLWELGVAFSAHRQTEYNWKEVDTEVKSKAETYTVQVVVPAKKKIQIQVLVGICGDNNIHTQMYKTLDAQTMKTLQIYNGMVTYHKISGSKGKGKWKGKGRK